jgi:hypothetical protein
VGGGKSSESNTQLENAQVQDANSLTGLAEQQGANSQQLFNLAFPGMQQSEQFYSSLASGNPNLIASAIAPAAQQIQQQSAGAKQNILSTAPAGGERNLAIQQVDVNQGAQVGALASQGYTSAFPALAQLGGQGAGLAQGAAGQATSAYGQSSSALGSVVGENNQAKGQSLGTFGDLAGGVSSGIGGGLGASAGGASSKGAAAAGLLAF